MTSGNLDKDAIKELAEILKETDLSEIEYEANGVKIRVARQLVHTSIAPSIQATTSAGAAPTSPTITDNAIKSPMVGTVYLAPEPGAMPFVKVGDNVSVGQNLLIIEAMKVLNPIKSSKAGVVKKILVRDAEPVEFGTPLVVIE